MIADTWRLFCTPRDIKKAIEAVNNHLRFQKGIILNKILVDKE